MAHANPCREFLAPSRVSGMMTWKPDGEPMGHARDVDPLADDRQPALDRQKPTRVRPLRVERAAGRYGLGRAADRHRLGKLLK